MGYDSAIKDRLSSLFTERMPGGSFIYRAEKPHELLFANQAMADLFECDTVEEFDEFVGHSFDGIVNCGQLTTVQKEIDLQIEEDRKSFDHVFYYIKTKKGNVRLVEDYGALVSDPQEGDVFYVFLISRDIAAGGSSIDHVTGLYVRDKFFRYIRGINKKYAGKDTSEYAIIYVNMVNFKLLNIKRGVAEGDACLRCIGEILRDSYEDSMVTRLQGDHFAVFCKYKDLYEKHRKAAERFRELYGNRYSIVGKNGICRFTLSEGLDVENLLSRAKVACDSIKHDPDVVYIEYSEKLQDRLNIEEYVEHHIQEAIDKEWIKVYYQPQIRTLTGALCGVEALARWEDPQYGLLTPDKFVNILEESRQLHKLDCFMVKKVCRDISERVNRGEPMVPVSLNFSKSDFRMCDIPAFVEQSVQECDIPRDYLHIEITESIIASDQKLMQEVTARFREAGYEIWMDDFGSAYSSLNVLKDYEFNTLKLDMKFLIPFTEKAKNIIRATVSMAKSIQLKTLSEGVETKEHLDFLTEIGCGRVQGYYYGRPEPLELMFEHMKEKGVETEKRLWRYFYDVASFHVRDSDQPLEILEDDGENFTTLFMNKAYLEQCRLSDLQDLREIDTRIYHTGSPLLKKYREYAKQIEESGNLETFYYSNNGNYVRFQGKRLAECDGHFLIEGSLQNITMDQNIHERDRLDSKIRDLSHVFDAVHLINIHNRTVSPLLGSYSYLGLKEKVEAPLDQVLDNFEKAYVHPKDREEILRFMNFETLRERVESTKKGYVEHTLRVRQKDGNYRWLDLILMMVSGTGAEEYLLCMRKTSTKVGEYMDLVSGIENYDNTEVNNEYATLWENAMEKSSQMFFWKDRNRKFRGVSQSFLDFYGIRSRAEIIGKNDEEMHWHVDDEPYKLDELAVLEEGRTVTDVEGQCIVGGVVHHLCCRKMPVYANGKIVGLMGSFRDLDADRLSDVEAGERALTDPVTGLMTARSFLGVMIDYAEQYHLIDKNYGLIVLRSVNHWRIKQTYGRPFAETVLASLGKRIIDITGQTCAVARVKEELFVVMTYVVDRSKLEKLEQSLKDHLEGLTQVNGNNVTINILTSMVLRSDEGVTDENIYGDLLKKVEEME